MRELGPWDGDRAAAARRVRRAGAEPAGDGELVLATWKQLLDDGRMQDGDDVPARHRPHAGRAGSRRARALDALGRPMVTADR